MCNLPSDFFGPRRKVALRDEDYAWASVWGSFDKIREVGQMLELIEAVSGRLIGPKTWNRSLKNFWNPFGQSVTVYGLFRQLVV